jgi:hypothetical protein
MFVFQNPNRKLGSLCLKAVFKGDFESSNSLFFINNSLRIAFFHLSIELGVVFSNLSLDFSKNNVLNIKINLVI